MREKERRSNVTILFPHLCFKVAPCSSYRESLMLSLPYTSGNFSLQNLSCIFQRWAFSNDLGIHEQASWMHTHLVSFVELSYTYSSQCVRCMAIPTPHIDINFDGHLHSPLISRVDVRLSPFLSSPHNLHHYILFHLQCYIHGQPSCIA